MVIIKMQNSVAQSIGKKYTLNLAFHNYKEKYLSTTE